MLHFLINVEPKISWILDNSDILCQLPNLLFVR